MKLLYEVISSLTAGLVAFAATSLLLRPLGCDLHRESPRAELRQRGSSACADDTCIEEEQLARGVRDR